MTAAPIKFRYEGEGEFRAVNQFWAGRADRAFVIGEVYPLEVREDRSAVTHNHQFAWIADAWNSLPESMAPDYPTAEHLRKRALIDCGFYDEEIVDAGSNAAALRVASYIRRMDDFAVVFVRGVFVIRRTAKSQSRRAMNKQEFQASKQAILEHIAGLIDVPPETLAKQAGLAA